MSETSADRENSKVVKLRLVLLIVATLLLIAIPVRILMFKEVEIEDIETEKVSTEDIISISELSADNVGTKVNVVGFMCNETGVDVSAAWICDSPFASKDEVHGELRIQNNDIIEYTPKAVLVSGIVRQIEAEYIDGNEKQFMIDEADIYIYGGTEPKYYNINSLIDDGVIDTYMKIFSAGKVEESAVEELNEAIAIACELGEEEIERIGRELTSNGDYEKLYDEFREALVNR